MTIEYCHPGPRAGVQYNKGNSICRQPEANQKESSMKRSHSIRHFCILISNRIGIFNSFLFVSIIRVICVICGCLVSSFPVLNLFRASGLEFRILCNLFISFIREIRVIRGFFILFCHICGPRLGHFWPRSGQLWPRCEPFGPRLASLGPRLATFGPRKNTQKPRLEPENAYSAPFSTKNQPKSGPLESGPLI